jgi:hypothetical protein
VSRAYQIPHSQFLAWDKDDRDKAIWEWVRTRQKCSSCGTRREEWLESEGGRRDAYHAVMDRCPGCEQVEYLRESADSKKDGKGTFIRLVPRA